jgi:hypothetical protein
MGSTRREGPRPALDTSGSGRKPSWSTQNQALAVVLILYEHALERPLTSFIQAGLNILKIGVGI